MQREKIEAWLKACLVSDDIPLAQVATIQRCDDQGVVLALHWHDDANLKERLCDDFNQTFDKQGLRLDLEVKILPRVFKMPVKALPKVKNVIAVGSGKGGVGKSTASALIALGLHHLGARVGLLDADIHGPNQPALLGVENAPLVVESGQMKPVNAAGIALMSMHYLLKQREDPVVWRGPMASKALMQMAGQTDWGELDYLIIDLPPGTGDIQLTMVQKLPLNGVVMVTTPQTLACLDTAKGIGMFQGLGIPILGVIENMATWQCTKCDHVDRPWGVEGAEALAEHYQIPLLGQWPLAQAMLVSADRGQLSAWSADKGQNSCYSETARQVGLRSALLPRRIGADMPPVVTQS